MRQLSSALTPFYKFVFPSLWIGGFALVTLLMFIVPSSFERDANVREMRWVLAGITVIGGSLIYWGCMRLKKVTLNAGDLVVSNYRRRFEVPLREVEAVSGSLFLSPELIWIRFRRPTPLGSKIVFMPKLRLGFGLSRHPLVAELRALISNPATHA